MSLSPGFDVHTPHALAEVLQLLDRYGPAARVIAGGTDLMPKLRNGRLSPAHLVSLNRVAELAGIEETEDGGLVIGGATRIFDVQRHPVVRERFPALHHACSVMATVQIRNMGTVAGNLANGSPCADTSGPLLAYDATLEVLRWGGRREVPVRGFHRGPASVDLRPDEIIAAIHLPPPPAPSGSAYERLSARSRVDMAAAGVAALVALNMEGRIAEARIGLSAVSPTPMRCPEAESLLRGEVPDAPLLERAGRAAAAESRPIDDVRATAAYRRHVVGVMAERVLAACVARASARASARDGEGTP
jgi:CO/xanthine dehydrogenase FAD-binding subunit